MCPIKGLGKIVLLFFTGYLLFSAVFVAFDQHPLVSSKTCSLCFLKKSLYAAINPFPIPDESDPTKIDILGIDEKVFYFQGLASYPFSLYRGPPLLGISL
jgi:hypothetical protein